MRYILSMGRGIASFAIAAGTLIVGSPLLAEPATTRDLTIEQTPLAEFAPPDSDLKVSAWVDRQDETYRAGDTVQLFVKTNKDAYVTIIDVGTSGKVSILLPNKHQPDNHVLAHQVLQIPGPDASYRIRVGGPAGPELIKVIATTRSDRLISSDQLSELGPFSAYRGTTERLTRDLSIEFKEKEPAAPTAPAGSMNKVIRIVADQGALSPPPTTSGPAGAVEPASASGVSADELFRLGEVNFYGDNGTPDYREAFRLFGLAAEAGHVGAMYFTGRIHEDGLDVDANPPLALTWYRKAAEFGSTPAMVRLALLYAKKDGPRHDLRETVRWLKKAASQGDGTAMVNLAKMHDTGIGVDREPREAARFLLGALKAGAWTVIDQASKSTDETRHEIQAQLKAAGQYNGPIDGNIGPDTRASLVAFARAG